VLYVKPPVRSGSYAVRVRLPSTITDTANAKNQLTPVSRCALFGALGSAPAATIPQLTAAALTSFSPDGDAYQDAVTWKVSADAATSFLRVRVTRAGRTVWARLAPVAAAGELTFVWDGTDETGRIARVGAYGYAIEAVNRAGVASAALRGYVEVDSAVHLVSVRRPQ
jgi:flagellar hook assembly protein FlgD